MCNTLPGEHWKPLRTPKDLLESAGMTNAGPEPRQGPMSGLSSRSPLILLAFFNEKLVTPVTHLLTCSEKGTAACHIATSLKV